MIIEDITIEDFKEFFQREFDYLKIWSIVKTYTKNEIVYYDNGLFYKSLKIGNLAKQPDIEKEYWEEIEANYTDFVNDFDLEKAFVEAKASFNINLFDVSKEQDIIKHCFLLLVAHFLVKDLAMSNGDGMATYLMSSKSVGSVSASYGIPKKILENNTFNYLGSTEFGLKYLYYISNRIKGNMFIVRGATTL